MATRSHGKPFPTGRSAKPRRPSSKPPMLRSKTATQFAALDPRPDAVPGTVRAGAPYAPAFEYSSDVVGRPLASVAKYTPAFEHRPDVAPPLLPLKGPAAFEHRRDAPGSPLPLKPPSQPAAGSVALDVLNSNRNQDVHWGPDGPPGSRYVAPTPFDLTRPIDFGAVEFGVVPEVTLSELELIVDRMFDEEYIPSNTELAHWENVVDAALTAGVGDGPGSPAFEPDGGGGNLHEAEPYPDQRPQEAPQASPEYPEGFWGYDSGPSW